MLLFSTPPSYTYILPPFYYIYIQVPKTLSSTNKYMFSINNNSGKLISNNKKNYATHHFSCKTHELNLDSDEISMM